ncbi:hypothetical protein CD30_03765 [Ureibacillus massiliensis 4400831 = CIP 108448 = CCUG 49529]|uniref:Uncharacterized protein n=1 Tax=Ureibacillus massiliensis 4400831 = CIP 108448 = CCUG 49529 TaxID=1211035 RepID=A0A0A3J7G6_9BACL|nr:hypothetical protein [Ureibacillus massiliensis]KGR91705.1 hypothetical protein CD30_03765 [Ureibacillus massiliensis 4400831 = CIP 108448 = CCUG 49529]
MKVKRLIIVGLILSIFLNLYFFQQVNKSDEESKLAMFEKVHDGITYSYNFGKTLQSKYNDISIKEQAEYLTAMSWSLQLSTHTLEIVEPKDERYRELANLFSVYSHIPSYELGAENVSDEEVLELLDIWLTDVKFLDEKLDYNQLAKMNYTELSAYWETLLPDLKYQNDDLIKYKQSFKMKVDY